MPELQGSKLNNRLVANGETNPVPVQGLSPSVDFLRLSNGPREVVRQRVVVY